MKSDYFGVMLLPKKASGPSVWVSVDAQNLASARLQYSVQHLRNRITLNRVNKFQLSTMSKRFHTQLTFTMAFQSISVPINTLSLPLAARFPLLFLSSLLCLLSLSIFFHSATWVVERPFVLFHCSLEVPTKVGPRMIFAPKTSCSRSMNSLCRSLIRQPFTPKPLLNTSSE